MSDDRGGSDERERSDVRRKFDLTAASPERDVLGVVAELEDADQTDLSPLYSTIDDVISESFSDPPAPEAQVTVTFTYEGYRITIHQDGSAEFSNVT